MNHFRILDVAYGSLKTIAFLRELILFYVSFIPRDDLKKNPKVITKTFEWLMRYM